MSNLSQLAVQTPDSLCCHRGMSRQGGRAALWRQPAVRLSNVIYSTGHLQWMETSKTEQTVGEQLYLQASYKLKCKKGFLTEITISPFNSDTEDFSSFPFDFYFPVTKY